MYMYVYSAAWLLNLTSELKHFLNYNGDIGIVIKVWRQDSTKFVPSSKIETGNNCTMTPALYTMYSS